MKHCIRNLISLILLRRVVEYEKNSLFGLKGHRIIGGLRASIYNAMPFEGLVALVDYMKEFKNTH